MDSREVSIKLGDDKYKIIFSSENFIRDREGSW